ncbi:NUDIX hydrolase [Mangrovimonas sp. CR14]|uniref:NUDIX hydrolase n=1 Tax=Mangrovimonas sp. CR14 TaxID=2706120 RepID=UPI001420113F|nr:NUDIX domain-containing protein [Mangrovimonas sp. CR14]NIK93319.1 NUDIX hydrolase [Mangrovimonas sp. CR14]
MKETIREQIYKESEVYYKDYLPHISIDCIVFGFHEGSLKVLLLQLMDYDIWAVPGGYLKKDENMDDAAHRILQERTGVTDIFLNQFKTFGKYRRTEDFFQDYDDTLWHKQRFISVGYYALIDYTSVTPTMDIYSKDCRWIDVDEVPSLMMDHRQIFDQALLELRRDLNYKPLGLNLLPEKFTMSELQKLYEIILDKELNRGNFFRKMKRYGILTKLDETRKGGAHKAPDLYSFNLEIYKKALENGLQESW